VFNGDTAYITQLKQQISKRCLPIFHCASAETPVYKLPVKNLTPPFASATPISCNRGITLLSEYIFAMFWRFL